MTSSTGAMVAAATMSLPERADQGRNYDYRYAWIRDQCFAGQAVGRSAAPTRCWMTPSASSPTASSTTAPTCDRRTP